jgi:hypothetical protein
VLAADLSRAEPNVLGGRQDGLREQELPELGAVAVGVGGIRPAQVPEVGLEQIGNASGVVTWEGIAAL